MLWLLLIKRDNRLLTWKVLHSEPWDLEFGSQEKRMEKRKHCRNESPRFDSIPDRELYVGISF